jgi:hypothetical protein
MALLQNFIVAEKHNQLLRNSKQWESDEARTLQVGKVGTVTKLVLINANKDNKGQALVDPIVNGTIVNLASYPVDQKFSIEAITSTRNGPIGSVQFQFGKIVNFQTENSSPYAMCRDTLGVFKPCTALVVGNHIVSAIPYSLASATGIKGQQLTVSFRIVKSNPSTPAPMLPPTIAPKVTPVSVPKSIPVTIPKSTPIAVPVATPVAVPKTAPVAVPNTTPIAVPKTTPIAVPVSTPVAVPKTTPVLVPKSIPVTNPISIPITIPKSIPVASPIPSPIAAPGITKIAKWIEVDPDAPINARHEACFVMVGRKAYLLAGRGRQAINIYDPVTRSWTNGATPPIQLHHSQCIAVNQSIWIVSAWTGGYPRENVLDKIYVSMSLLP